MKVYLQCDKNMKPIDYDHFNAYCGFREMGFEIIFFNTYEQLLQSDPEDIIIGFIGTVNAKLASLNLEIKNLDYPDSIKKYLMRKVWISDINTINSNPSLWPVFVKPINNKVFTGRAIRTTKDLIGCGCCGDNTPVFCSEVVNFVAEYRVFVRYGKILDARQYKGDWSVNLNAETVKQCVNDFSDAPFAYAIDFGVTEDDKTMLIEVNNTCSIGSYGLNFIAYAKFLSTRWAELTNTEDACDFENERVEFIHKYDEK